MHTSCSKQHHNLYKPNCSPPPYLNSLFLVVIPRPAASPLGEAGCNLTALTNEKNSTCGRSSGNYSLSRCLDQSQKAVQHVPAATGATATLMYPSFSPPLTELCNTENKTAAAQSFYLQHPREQLWLTASPSRQWQWARRAASCTWWTPVLCEPWPPAWPGNDPSTRTHLHLWHQWTSGYSATHSSNLCYNTHPGIFAQLQAKFFKLNLQVLNHTGAITVMCHTKCH